MNLSSPSFRAAYIISIVLLLFLSIYSVPVYSESQKDILANAEHSFSSGLEPSPILPDILCSDIDDQATQTVCWSAYQSGLNYFHDGLKHRKKVFQWQYLSSLIIFFVVLTLVFVGVYFAWIQFKIDMKSAKTGSNKDHSVEVSTSGIKVSSPVLGVIILTLSLVFFYLYLAFVYPITEIF